MAPKCRVHMVLPPILLLDILVCCLEETDASFYPLDDVEILTQGGIKVAHNWVD